MAREATESWLGLAAGWVLPSLCGSLKTPGTLARTWEGCLKAIGVKERFTVHGLRRTFNDLTRLAGTDGLVIRALTGHTTSAMTAHYLTVRLEEGWRWTGPLGWCRFPKLGTRLGTALNTKTASWRRPANWPESLAFLGGRCRD